MFEDEIQNFCLSNPNNYTGIISGEEEVRQGGQPKFDEIESKEMGRMKEKEIYDKITYLV